MKKRLSSKIDRKFYKKVLMLSIIAIMVLTLAISGIIYLIMDRSVNDTIRKNETFNAIRISQNFEDKLNNISSIVHSFASMDAVPIEQLDNTTQLWIRRSLNNSLNSHLLGYSYISSIYLNLAGIPFSAGQILEEPFTALCNYQGNTVSLCTETDWPYYIQFENNQSIHSPNKTVIQVNAVFLVNFVFTSTDLFREEYIVDESNTILLSCDTEKMFTSFSSVIDLDIQEDGITTVNYKGQKCYAISRRISEDAPFYYVSLIDADYYHSTARNAILTSLLVGLVLLAIALVSVYWIVNYTYRPIREILETLKYYSQDVSLYENEIHFIHTRIKENIQEKEQLKEQLPETIKKLHLAQIQTLQAQIDPHFLFNTLENIKGLSIKKCGTNNEIEQCLLYLNGILFESIGKKQLLSSVTEEIRITELYIKLMQIRFSDCFTVEWDIAPETSKINIIRFTLQPIIENCILKGFKHTQSGYKIKICMKCFEDNLIIQITDNGHGMEKEQLEQLLSDLSNHETYPTGSVGLKNINLRVELLFGTNYGITNITSDSNGTSVELKLPITKGLLTL